MPVRLQGIVALVLVTLVWGTTFPAMKDLSTDFPAVWIAFLRFSVAGVILSPFLLRARRADWSGGALLGAMLFAAFMFQVEALALMSANRNAFITGLNVLIVPLLGVLAGRFPEPRIIAATALAVAGLFAMCWDGGSWSFGDTLALLGAVCFGVYVKMMEVCTRKASSLMSLTAIQIATVAACAALWILAVSPQPVQLPALGRAITDNFWNLFYLGVIATAAIVSLQTWGQRQCSANEAAIVYALEPAFAAVAAYFWLSETMTLRSVLGGALLIAGMLVSQWTPRGRPVAAAAQ
jgi:drug/metabolite transporter (DMT)-like permease